MVDMLPRTVAEACRAEAAGQALKFLFFWGHQPAPDGRVTASCLSQWWEADFTVDGVTYRSAEHFMMASKAMLFDDSAAADRILAASHPNDAKKLGREVRGFDEDTWNKHRFDIVVRANAAKFGQHPDLSGFLLSTEKRLIVEASPVDRVWGIGLTAQDERAQRPSTWRGLNLLGFALIDVRTQLA
ncbi:NADAR family protein [Fodinicola feengrottensis]